jgi:hypothetical protein
MASNSKVTKTIRRNKETKRAIARNKNAQMKRKKAAADQNVIVL